MADEWIYNWKNTLIGLSVFLFFIIFMLAIAPAMGATQTYIMFYLEMVLIGTIVLITVYHPMIQVIQGAAILIIKLLFLANTNIYTTAMVFFIGLSMIVMGFYRLVKSRTPRPEEVGYINSQNEEFHLLAKSPMWFRLAIPCVFSIAIVASIFANPGVMYVPVPSAFGLTPVQMASGNFTLTAQPAEDVFLSSVPVGFAEDMFNLAVVVTIILWLRFFAHDVMGAARSMPLTLIFTIIGLLAGAWIFASAHYTNPNYISNPTAQQSAFMFSIINIGIMLMTGLFLPLPHILHNAMAVGFMYNAMALPFILTPLMLGFPRPRPNSAVGKQGRITPPGKRGLVLGIVLVALIVLTTFFLLGRQSYSFTTNDCAALCISMGYTYTTGSQCYCSGTTFAVNCDGNHMVYRPQSVLCGYGCGDGYCAVTEGENTGNCIQDCGYCGDGTCYVDESSVSCPQDCGSSGGGDLPPIVCENTCTYHPSLHVKKCENKVIYECGYDPRGICGSFVWVPIKACILACYDSSSCAEDHYYGTIGISIGEVVVSYG